MNPEIVVEYEWDGVAPFVGEDSEVIYDVDGEQHVEMLDAEECS